MNVWSFFLLIPPYRIAPPNEKEQVIQRRTDRGYAIRSRSDVNYFRSVLHCTLSPRNTGSLAEYFYEKVRKTLLLHITFFLYLLLCSCPIFRTVAELTFNFISCGERCSPLHPVFYFSEQNFTSLPSSIMFVVLTAHILPHIEQVCLSAGGVCSKNLLAFSPSSAISNISSQSIL